MQLHPIVACLLRTHGRLHKPRLHGMDLLYRHSAALDIPAGHIAVIRTDRHGVRLVFARYAGSLDLQQAWHIFRMNGLCDAPVSFDLCIAPNSQLFCSPRVFRLHGGGLHNHQAGPALGNLAIMGHGAVRYKPGARLRLVPKGCHRRQHNAIFQMQIAHLIGGK